MNIEKISSLNQHSGKKDTKKSIIASEVLSREKSCKTYGGLREENTAKAVNSVLLFVNKMKCGSKFSERIFLDFLMRKFPAIFSADKKEGRLNN